MKFHTEWPITDDTMTLRQMLVQVMPDVAERVARSGVILAGPPTFTITIAPGRPAVITADAPATARAGRAGRAACGTDGGYYRHTRTLKEPACHECRAAHATQEARRKLNRADKVNA